MFKNINLKIQVLSLKNNYSFIFSITRVFVTFLLLKEIISIWDLIPTLYSNNSFLVPTSYNVIEFFTFDATFIREHIYIYLGLYIFALICYLLGIGKQFTALVVFLMFDICQKMCPWILNGGDNILKFLLFYMIFADSYEYFSVTPLKKEYKNKFYILNFFTNLAGIAICFHLCLIYFVSALHKTHADVWFHGIATYYTLQIERFKATPFNVSLANNTFFVVVSSYFTLFVELFYPILVWFKKTRKYFIISMICLHISIYVFMMIYDFQLVFIFIQGFFFTNEEWLKFYDKIKNIVFSKTKIKKLI